jgi:exopolysaccharide biosynthesis polyprenyl glycosylphosphotransferase
VRVHLLYARGRRIGSTASLVVLDLVGVGLAVFLALMAAQVVEEHRVFPGLIWRDVESRVLPFIAVTVLLVFAKDGLYRAREFRPTGARVTASMAFVTVIVAVFARVAADYHTRTYLIYVVFFTLSAAIISALRASYDSITLTLMQLRGIRRRTLLAGPTAALPDLQAALRQSAGRGPRIEVIGVVAESGSAPALPGIPTVGTMRDLPELVDELRPHDLVVGGLELPDEEMLALVERCRETRTRLRLVPTTSQLLLERATFVPGQVVPLLEVRPPVFVGMDWAVKRTFDVVVSLLLLVLLAPLMALVALAVRLTSPGSVIFRDRRVGVGEREFDMLKFRSMYRDAPELQAELELLNEADGALFKIRRDPRVTPIGRFLRRFSLDELPQLVNVLRGEMSLVGPRPLPVRDFELLEAWHRRRYLLLPGITGLWQTSRSETHSFDDLVRLDFSYFENWSIWLDIAIILRTPLAVIRGRGAF